MGDRIQGAEHKSGPLHLDLDDVIRALESVPIFDGCSPDVLAEVARHGHLLAFADGSVIVPEGEAGLGFYLILTGRARVVHDARTIATLERHDFFGEMALVDGGPRRATVLADGSTICLGLLRSHFKTLLVRSPRLAMRILEVQARREAEIADPA